MPRKFAPYITLLLFLVGAGAILWIEMVVSPGAARKQRESEARHNLLMLVNEQQMYALKFGNVAPDARALDAAGLVSEPQLAAAFQNNGSNADSLKPTPLNGYVYVLLLGPPQHFGIMARPAQPADGRYAYLILDDVQAWWRFNVPGVSRLTAYPPVGYDFAAAGWTSEDDSSHPAPE